MKKLEFVSTVGVYDSIQELPDEEQELLDLARKELDFAYAPYSNFRVGAAVLLNNGKTFPGCNQENASFPLCICGERVALFNAGANYPKEAVKTLAIIASNDNMSLDKAVAPCGACRQVILEFELKHNQDIRILLMGDGEKIYVFNSAKELLPFYFDSSYLFKS